MVGPTILLFTAIPTAVALLMQRLPSTSAPAMQCRASSISMGGAPIDATALDAVPDMATMMRTRIARALDDECVPPGPTPTKYGS